MHKARRPGCIGDNANSHQLKWFVVSGGLASTIKGRVVDDTVDKKGNSMNAVHHGLGMVKSFMYSHQLCLFILWAQWSWSGGLDRTRR
jgi:hypothetical protein